QCDGFFAVWGLVNSQEAMLYSFLGSFAYPYLHYTFIPNQISHDEKYSNTSLIHSFRLYSVAVLFFRYFTVIHHLIKAK
ncbi:hypothetical protein V6237_16285, partial [Pseudoalteromonas carrageenovora]|uniref:hypothetical protein n=1 Tax=Pseudoalteromonas carrageenovora TaxID=227 RepID=UPI00311E1253